MININFPTSKNIYIEINGEKVAAVENYKVKISREEKYIEAIGESEPICVIAGKIRFIIELSKIYISENIASDGIDFYNLSSFNLVVVKPDRKVIYSGCEWVSLNESTTVNEKIFENAVIVAVKKLEVKR